MADFLSLVWLATIVAIIYFARSMSKGKKNKETKFSYEKSKKFLIISIVVSFISFIGIGITALPVENTTSNNTVNNVVNEIINENVATNEVKEENDESKTYLLSYRMHDHVMLPEYSGAECIPLPCAA